MVIEIEIDETTHTTRWAQSDAIEQMLKDFRSGKDRGLHNTMNWDVKSRDQDLFVIASNSEKGYWSNDDGWVCDVESATKFTKGERDIFTPPFMNQYDDARWVNEKDAKDFED